MLRAGASGAPLAASILLVTVSCTGVIGDAGGASPGDGTPPRRGAAGFVDSAVPTLHRLTVTEYQNTVRDIFPGLETVPTDLDPDTRYFGFTSVASSELTISPRALEQYETAALSVAEQVLESSPDWESFVGCTPTAPTDACVRDFIARMGRRAWRRPLGDDEVLGIVSVVQSTADLLRG